MTPLPAAYQLRISLVVRISLVDSEPEIWRQVIVPTQIDLDGLHQIIQLAMGWENAHRYAFHLGSGDQKAQYETSEPIAKVLANDKPLYYTYDFESGWLHRITVEAAEAARLSKHQPTAVPACSDGAGACPPEGTGGIWGYNDFLERLEDPEDPDYINLIETYSDFDQDRFDPAQATARLRKLDQILASS